MSPQACEQRSIFKTAEGEARYRAAYDAALRLWPVPYEELDMPSRLGRTHVIASGPVDAPPLVLLPGNYVSATMWHACVGELSRGYRTFAVDTIGDLGKSVPSRLPANRPDYAQWLLDVYDQLGIGQPHIVGTSYGGFLALNLALAAPDRVGRMVLLCPGVPSFAPISMRWAIRGMPMMVWPRRATIRWFYQGASAKPLTADDPIVAQMTIGMMNLRAPSPLRPAFADEELRGLRAPVLLLIGEKEILYDAESALKRARQLIPHMQAEMVPGAGHLLLADQPETVKARVLEFLGH